MRRMGKRFLLDSIGLVIVLMFPWWVGFIVVIVGTIFFPWYVEALFFGAIYDILYGGVVHHWYLHITQLVIFAIPLFVAEFIKTRIVLRK